MVAFSEMGWNVSELTRCGLDGNTLDAKSIIDELNVWCHAVPLYGDIPIFHHRLPEQRKRGTQTAAKLLGNHICQNSKTLLLMFCTLKG